MKTLMRPHILAIDDEQHALNALRTAMLLEGYDNVTCIADSREVKPLLQKRPVDVILLDLDMPHITGQDLLAYCSGACPQVPVIVVTAASDISTAIHCVKTGAFDYLVKPIDVKRLTTSVVRALEMSELRRENMSLARCLTTGELAKPESFAAIQTKNHLMLTSLAHAEAVAPSSHPVLLLGETGVGKDLVAHGIHNASGRPGRFVAVNAAGMDDNVFADSLFGHERGAFTGADNARAGLLEEAAGGTLFLDEIGDLSVTSQVKLLRLLQEGDYFPVGSDRPKKAAVRFIFATNANLQRLLTEGRFRKDLYYRLCTHEIRIHPLRERKEDIPLLAGVFIRQTCLDLKRSILKMDDELGVLLAGYDYPGNVRELRGLLVDAIGMCKTQSSLRDYIRSKLSANKGRVVEGKPVAAIHEDHIHAATEIRFPHQMPTLKEVSDAAFAEAMKRTDGNQRKMARILGVSQPAISKRMRQMTRGSREANK